jgi:hypothetical protein
MANFEINLTFRDECYDSQAISVLQQYNIIYSMVQDIL